MVEARTDLLKVSLKATSVFSSTAPVWPQSANTAYALRACALSATSTSELARPPPRTRRRITARKVGAFLSSRPADVHRAVQPKPNALGSAVLLVVKRASPQGAADSKSFVEAMVRSTVGPFATKGVC